MKTHHFIRTLLGIGTVLSAAILLNLWEPLRGDYGWRWPYSAPEHLYQWLPSTLSLILYSMGAWALMRRIDRPVWHIMTWAFVGGVILPFIFLARWGDPLFHQFTRVASGGTSGPHRIAMQYTPDELDNRLKNWTDEQKRFAEDHISIHAALAPPALPLLYYGTGQALEQLPFIADPLGETFRPLQCQNLEMAHNSNAELASASLGMLSPLWATLAIFPLLWLGRRVIGERGARWAVLTWSLCAGIAVFTPIPNTVFPTLTLICVALLWSGLEKEHYLAIFGAGVVMSLLTFLNFSVIPLIMFCGWLTLGYHLLILNHTTTPPSRFWSIQMGLVFGLGLVSLWGLWLLYGGESPLFMLTTAMNQHLELERPYAPWLVLHLWDYGLFLGLPLFFLSAYGFFQAAKTALRTRIISPLGLIALALGLTLLIVDISGTARGETGRVWQFFFPFSVLVAIGVLLPTDSIQPPSELRPFLMAQTFAAWVMVIFIGAVGTGLEVAPQTPPFIADSTIRTDTNIRFGESLRLTGFGGELDDQNQLVLDLRWQADDWQPQPYYIAIIPVAPDGTPYRESFVYQPFEAAYPISCWQPAQTVIDRVSIPLEGNPPAGEWWLSVTVHHYDDFAKLPVTLPDGSTGDQAGIGAIPIP